MIITLQTLEHVRATRMPVRAPRSAYYMQSAHRDCSCGCGLWSKTVPYQHNIIITDTDRFPSNHQHRVFCYMHVKVCTKKKENTSTQYNIDNIAIFSNNSSTLFLTISSQLKTHSAYYVKIIIILFKKIMIMEQIVCGRQSDSDRKGNYALEKE